MNQQDFSLPDAPAQRVITDVIAVLRSLTDNNNKTIFTTVLPLTEVDMNGLMLDDKVPAAFVYFGEVAEGYDTSNQFDEMYFFPFLEILFMSFIPKNDDIQQDVQRLMLALHWKVIQNLRIPTDDLLTGLPYQKNINGKELWEFRSPDGQDFRKTVEHKFDIRTQWIQDGKEVKNWFYLHSIKIQVQVNNFNADA
jgi:hypothetical protein